MPRVAKSIDRRQFRSRGGRGTATNVDLNKAAEDYVQSILNRSINKEALCFGLLLYRLRDNSIKDIIENKNKLIALNEITGKNLTLTLFTSEELTNLEALIKPDVITNKILIEVFQIKNEVKYPCFLFFQVKKGYIINYFFVEIEGKIEEDTYAEMVSILETGEEALSKIKPEFRHEYENVFNQFEDSIKGEGKKAKSC